MEITKKKYYFNLILKNAMSFNLAIIKVLVEEIICIYLLLTTIVN